MTLYKQLLFWSFSILFLMCASLLIIDFNQTKNFIELQLKSHSQDAATSLGLSISSVARGTDVAVMETMANALFDSGYYQSIQIKDMDGQLLVNRSMEASIEGVPAWFVKAFTIAIPGASALIMGGWQQLGIIHIKSNPGYAYTMLWKSATSDVALFIVTFLMIALVGGFILKKLLSPLQSTEEQAIALSERKFIIQESLPKTRELKNVVQAMNRATQRLREIFNEQASMADSLLQKSYQDPLTQLGNRRYIEDQIKAKVTLTEEANGTLLIYQIQNLQKINQTIGYQKTDNLIQDMASIAKKACVQYSEYILGRLGGSDFVLLLPNSDLSMAEDFAEHLIVHMNQHIQTVYPNIDIKIAIGGAHYSKPITFGELLARSDAALTQSISKNTEKITIVDIGAEQSPLLSGKIEYRKKLDEIIQNKDIVFYLQPNFYFKNLPSVFHYEILSRFSNKGQDPISIGTLIPFAEQERCMPRLDRVILESLLSVLHDSIEKRVKLAINLSPLSIANDDFMSWIPNFFTSMASKNATLSFEFHETRITHFERKIQDFADKARTHGHLIGIDHFGHGLTNLRYDKSILPDYVKIDRSITHSLQKEGDESFFLINTLCNVAHSLNIKVIVEGIEKKEQIDILKMINIDAVQGFYYQVPKPMDKIYTI